MSYKISQIRIVSINGIPVLAAKSATTPELKNWFETSEEFEVQSFGVLSLTARPDQGEPTYAEQIEQMEFDPADLPMVL